MGETFYESYFKLVIQISYHNIKTNIKLGKLENKAWFKGGLFCKSIQCPYNIGY